MKSGACRDPHAVVAELKRRVGWIYRTALDAIVEQAQDIDWTRDVFDRLIVAQAALDAAALVTTDRTIRKHYPKAVW